MVVIPVVIVPPLIVSVVWELTPNKPIVPPIVVIVVAVVVVTVVSAVGVCGAVPHHKVIGVVAIELVTKATINLTVVVVLVELVV